MNREVTLQGNQQKVEVDEDTIYEKGRCFYTSDYWECDCVANFVHKVEEESCPRCDVHRRECPDAMLA